VRIIVRKLTIVVSLWLIVSPFAVSPTTANDANLGYRIFYFNYTEPGIEESGILHGLQGDYNFYVSNYVNLGVSGSLSGGGLTYEGRTLSDDPRPVTTESDDLITNGEITLSIPRAYQSDPVTPSVGLGYRLWINDLKNSGNVRGYTREIEYLYLPLGITVDESFTEQWSGTFKARLRYLLEGTVTSNLSEVRAGYPDVENTQDQGKGLRLQYMFHRESRYNSDYSVGFFLNFWDIQQSNIVSTNADIDNADGDNDPSTGDTEALFEPKNETLMVGLNLSFTF
jgi:hypothetical protein